LHCKGISVRTEMKSTTELFINWYKLNIEKLEFIFKSIHIRAWIFDTILPVSTIYTGTCICLTLI